MKKIILLLSVISFSLTAQTVLPGKSGGTGVNNGTKTITLANSLNYPANAAGFFKNNGSGTLTWDSGTGTFLPLAGGTMTGSIKGSTNALYSNGSMYIGSISSGSDLATADIFGTGSILKMTTSSFDLRGVYTGGQPVPYMTGIVGSSVATLEIGAIDDAALRNRLTFNREMIFETDFTTFVGLQYETFTGGFVKSNNTGLSILHRDANDLRYAPISYTAAVTSATLPLSIAGNVISSHKASATDSGYLSATDWVTLSGKLANNLGISGGTTLIGGTAAAQNLTLQSTSNATRGKILFGTSAYDEVNNRLGIGVSSPTYTLDVNGDIGLGTAGSKLRYKTNVANCAAGSATLSGGTLVISTTAVTTTSLIFLTSAGGTVTNLGTIYVSAKSAGVSFTVTSTNVLDASNFNWFIIEPY